MEATIGYCYAMGTNILTMYSLGGKMCTMVLSQSTYGTYNGSVKKFDISDRSPGPPLRSVGLPGPSLIISGQGNR